MNLKLIATITGGLPVLLTIAYINFGSVVFTTILIFLSFLVGVFFGAYSFLYPLIKKPGQHIYINKKIVIESMLIPKTGLRDSSNNLLEPGEIYMMNIDGQLDKVTSPNFRKGGKK